jgi:ABC-type transport system involved in cytochrome c biogenesis permease component
VMWLLADESRLRGGAWLIVGAWGVLALSALWLMPSGAKSSFLSWYTVLPFGFALKILFALQACRFFVEGRRSGSLELLLCTPLTNREIVQGQALALWWSFRWPLVCFFVFLFAPLFLKMGVAVSNLNFQQGLSAVGSSVISGIYSVRMAADLLALCWVGIALALTMKRPALAPALTILFVLVLPSLLCWWLDALVDLVFIAWGRSKVHQDLRRLIAQQYTAPLVAPTIAPPVLAR